MSHGRIAPSDPLPYPGIAPDNTRYPHEWNKPRQLFEPCASGSVFTCADLAEESAEQHPVVKQSIQRFIHQQLSEKEQTLPLHEQIALLEKSEPYSTALRIRRERANAEKADYQRQQAEWQGSPEGVANRLSQQPYFIRQVWKDKIDWLRANRSAEHVNAFFMGTVKKALLRLDGARRLHDVNSQYSSELVGYFGRRWPHLPVMNKREILTLANELASRVNEMFYTELGQRKSALETLPADELHYLYRHLAVEIASLRIVPPMWNKLSDQRTFDRLDCFSALARMMHADWWGRRLWRMRCNWRENQLRAVGVIHKRRMPYISQDALTQWQEQRRKNFQFLQTHELVDEEGNIFSLEAMAMASVSNPVNRRYELMTRMAGLEMVAMQRSDEGVFLTITCPSKYHANTLSGHMNPKWNAGSADTSCRTPEQGQAWLNTMWQRATAKLKRHGIRPYGFRVAEPHHDATPHWHVLAFIPKEQRKEMVSILRDYFIAEDRAELGRHTGARFKAKIMDPKKGSATAYVAKYISKNIDGYALEGERDSETGKPLKETARLAMAWASTHRIRQYQPFGTPPITVYRELRKLNNQLAGVQLKAGTFKRGKALLADPAMDAVMAAADVGCFATYINKQGGVLIPRENYTVRLAYQDCDEPNAYGEMGVKIYGVFSPRLGDTSRICTRQNTYTIRSKATNGEAHSASAVEASALPVATGDTWSSVNNSTGDQKTDDPEEVIHRTSAQFIDEDGSPSCNFDALIDSERRQLLNRLRQPTQKRRDPEPPVVTLVGFKPEKITHLQESASMEGVDLFRGQAVLLLQGHKLQINGKWWHELCGEFRPARPPVEHRITQLRERMRKKTGDAIDNYPRPVKQQPRQISEIVAKHISQLRSMLHA